MHKNMNIYLCGVGGQGIGLLSEVLFRACSYSGYKVRGCDTHGLAQRGGSVVSHLRLGSDIFTPLVEPGTADLVIALERLEGWRAVSQMLRAGGDLVYFDAVYQPIDVRIGHNRYVEPGTIQQFVTGRGGRVFVATADAVPDPRMQNVALLGLVAREGLVPGLTAEALLGAIREVVPARALEANVAVFERARG